MDKSEVVQYSVNHSAVVLSEKLWIEKTAWVERFCDLCVVKQ